MVSLQSLLFIGMTRMLTLMLRCASLVLLWLQGASARRPRWYSNSWRRLQQQQQQQQQQHGGFVGRRIDMRGDPWQRRQRLARQQTLLLQTKQWLQSGERRGGGEAGTPSMQLGIGSTDRYPGQPEMQYDGTEGNGAFYGGNYQPGFVGDPNNPHTSFGGRSGQGSLYWHDNPYWDYFKQVWGGAPFIDANFRLWMSGYMKKFPGASHHLEDGNTNVLPTWLGYTHEKYDPLTDPPYRSTDDIFGGKVLEAAEDCSQPFGPYALGYKRPCAKSGSEGSDREKEAKSYTMAQHKVPTGDILGRNTWWNRLPTETRWGAGTNYFLHPQSKFDAAKTQLDLTKEHAQGLDTPGEQPNKPEAPPQIPVPGEGSESGVFGWKKDKPAKAGGESVAAAGFRLRRR